MFDIMKEKYSILQTSFILLSGNDYMTIKTDLLTSFISDYILKIIIFYISFTIWVISRFRLCSIDWRSQKFNRNVPANTIALEFESEKEIF